MALPTGSGTETLHAHAFTDLDATQIVIIGVQHHVYTVLSIVIYAGALNAISDYIAFRTIGWDHHAGASGATQYLFFANPRVGETFVWDNKFSFNGFEPTGSSGSFSDATEQAAGAAQGGSTAQRLEASPSSSADDYDVTVTYLDQDWS